MTWTFSSSASTLAFLAFAGLVYAAAFLLVGQLPELERPGAVATGITLDLVVLVPLAFYGLVLRRYGVPITAIAPILILSLVAATFILPREHQQALHVSEAIIAPLELGLLGWIAWRAVRALRRARHGVGADPLEEFRRATHGVVPISRAAEIVASEIALFYYALGAWRTQPHAPCGTHAFTHHSRSGHGGLVFGLLVLTVAEGVAVHLLLDRWSAVVAWFFTIGTLYGALWLIADYRATVLRPVLAGQDEVWIRAGLRWSVRVPRAQIAAVERKPPEGENAGLSLAMLTTPTHWVTFTEPVRVQGPYGFSRDALALGLVPDAPEEFSRTLTAPGAGEPME